MACLWNLHLTDLVQYKNCSAGTRLVGHERFPMAIPANQLPIGAGLYPNGTEGAMFFVDLAMLDQLEENGPAWKFDDRRFLEEVVTDPDVIFEGLKRQNLEDCFCYCVQPRQDPDEPAAEVQPFFLQVFLAFVRPGVGGYVVFDWAWRQEDEGKAWHPLGWENDFTRPTWTRP
jgi:hypothetical protein